MIKALAVKLNRTSKKLALISEAFLWALVSLCVIEVIIERPSTLVTYVFLLGVVTLGLAALFYLVAFLCRIVSKLTDLD